MLTFLCTFPASHHEISWFYAFSWLEFWVWVPSIFKMQPHLSDLTETSLLEKNKHSYELLDKQTLGRGGSKRTNSTESHWTYTLYTEVKRRARVQRQLLIIYWSIYSFCRDTFPCCPKVLHKEVMVRCPICFDQKTGKEGKPSMWSWKQTHIQRLLAMTAKTLHVC